MTRSLISSFFFLKNPAPPEISPFPLPAPLPIPIQPVNRRLGDGLFEVAQLSRGAPNLHFAVLLDDGDARRIVAAILEPPQTVQNQRHDFLRSNIPDDPAHVSLTPASNFKELAKGNPSATNLD